MKVNEGKTQLLCVSANKALQVSSHIEADGKIIESDRSMKFLGFVLESGAGMGEHVTHLTKKAMLRSWSLVHLKNAGIKEADLISIYKSLIRPIIEYGCQLYHHQLTVAQSQKIEGLQRKAMRTIWGPGTSYREALLKSDLPRLEERREEIFRRFAIKTLGNPRYAHWFPKSETVEHNLRRRNHIELDKEKKGREDGMGKDEKKTQIRNHAIRRRRNR